MRADSESFTLKNQASEKRPKYVIRLSFDNANTDLLYLTSDNYTETPSGATVVYDVVKGLSGQTQQINPDKGNSTIGGFSFNVVDKDRVINDYIAGKLATDKGLRHKQVKVYIGYDGLLWADYTEILTYIVDGVTSIDGELKFTCSDIQRQARKQIFDPEITQLAASVTSTDLFIPANLAVTTKFKIVEHDASYSDRPSLEVGYIRIEDEIICHTGVFDDGASGFRFHVATNGRGALNTKAAEHILDASVADNRQLKITEHIYLEGAAPKVAYAILTGNLEGQAKTIPDHWHLGISTSYLKLTDFTGIGDDLWNTTTDQGRHVRFSGYKKKDGKQFIEKEIMYWLGCFMPIYSSGEIGLKRLTPVLSDSGYLVELNESNIVKYGELKHDFKSVVNQMSIDWNYVFSKEEFTKTTYLIDADSISKHNDAPERIVKLYGVHTGAHTDEDIHSYFDTLRDRYSGPPLRLNLTVLPSLNILEVGDTVNVNLSQIRDFNTTNTEINRVFEIQKVSTDWITGNVNLELFGSSQKAGTLERTTLSSVVADSFYSSLGTELSTVLTISAGVVTANGSLTGAATMAGACFYYLGNLTINSGVTVTISDNVQLRVMGSLTINGKIDGKGQGHVGGVGATLWQNGLTVITLPVGTYPDHNAGSGTVGYLGITQPAKGFPFVSSDSYTFDPLLIGNPSINYFSIDNKSTSLNGLPTNLIGTSGSGGGVAHSAVNQTRTITIAGTDGGASGAGLLIVSRGGSFGAGGSIDLSGIDGVANELTVTNGNYTQHGSSGAGGAPGGLVWLLDGNSTPPELGIYVESLFGDSYHAGTGTIDFDIYPPTTGFTGFDMGASAYSLQYIPPYEVSQEELDKPPPNIATFSALQVGDGVVFKWGEVYDFDLDGYEIRYTPSTVTDWESATPVTFATKGTKITDAAIIPGTWKFYIKAYDLGGRYSQTAATSILEVVTAYDVISSVQHDPTFTGTLTNFIWHHTGKLVPDSQNLASADGWDTFDIAVVNPYQTCTFESAEQDISFDDTVRIWAETTSSLMPSETGVAKTDLYVDYKTAAGSYDGFELWEVGTVTARYAKFKIQMDTGAGVAYVDGHTTIMDIVERTEKASGVTVAATGTAITFAQQFHSTPFIRVFDATGTGLIPTYTGASATGFTAWLYNTSGTAVAGTVDWEATGV